MDQHEYQTGQRGGYKRGSTHHDATKDRTKHNGDDVIERRFLAKGADARDPDQHESQEEAYCRATDHLEAVEVCAVSKERI